MYVCTEWRSLKQEAHYQCHSFNNVFLQL